MLVGLVTVIIAGVLLYIAQVSQANPNTYFYPKCVLVVLLVASLFLIFRNGFSKSRDSSFYLKDYSLKRAFLITIATGFTFYLSNIIGFYVGTLLFCSAVVLFTGGWRNRSWLQNLKVLSIAFLFTICLFLCFYLLLESPVPSAEVNSIYDHIRPVLK